MKWFTTSGYLNHVAVMHARSANKGNVHTHNVHTLCTHTHTYTHCAHTDPQKCKHIYITIAIVFRLYTVIPTKLEFVIVVCIKSIQVRMCGNSAILATQQLGILQVT